MKLSDHVEYIRQLIDTTFRNRLGRMGITDVMLQVIDSVPDNFRAERSRIEPIREVLIAETGSVVEAFDKMVEEFTFTLFNRIAALKVIEAHTLQPEIITRRSQHGDRSFAHKHWLEQNPEERNKEMEGLVHFMEDRFAALGDEIPLFSPQHPYHLLPTAIELNTLINAFNAVESDEQIDSDIWKSDDVLGWLYESYNNHKKAAHKESGNKTEYNKVSIQSQIYTPRWVVKFLVDNSLGKFYLEMYPDSDIKNRYNITHDLKTQKRTPLPLKEIKLIDPATGSGNFLLYGFDLFYDLYIDQIENYGADYNENKIPELIITYNLHGIDLDDRAVQLAQLGLYIKAKRKKRTAKIDHFNVVSSDFFLPAYVQVQQIFEENTNLDTKEKEIISDIWSDLQQAYKFGSLIRLEEKLNTRFSGLAQTGISLFSESEATNYEEFRNNFFENLQKAVLQNAARQGQSFLNTKTQDAITFLQLLTQKYDVALTNPPYTDSADFGSELKGFIDANYKQSYKFNSNLYAAFLKRCSELVKKRGFIAMLHPLTFMYIFSFKDVRKYIINKTHLEILAELGLGGVFASSDVQADVVAYVLKNSEEAESSIFLDFKKYKNHTNKPEIFKTVYENLNNNLEDDHVFKISQNSFKVIQDWPFIYWISDSFRSKFRNDLLDSNFNIAQGLATSNNDRFVRHWWEIAIKLTDSLSSAKWYHYSKGGTYNKWHGNNWAVVNWANNGAEIRNIKDESGKQRSRPQNEQFYFKKGVTYSASGSKGASFRIQYENSLFDVGGSCIFPTKNFKNIEYLIALLNSKLAFYILECLNPTVNTQVGDMQRIPFVKPTNSLETVISELALENIEIKRALCTYRIIETNYNQNPLLAYTDSTLQHRLINHLNYENARLTITLINEAIINKLIFQVYELNPDDQRKVEVNMGKSVGNLPVNTLARKEFLSNVKIHNHVILQHIEELKEIKFDEHLIMEIKENFNTLYQGNSNLEEFCIKFQINPINVWYWFRDARFLPDSVPSEFTLELLADTFRTLLMEDNDGIIPLVGIPGEPCLLDRFEQYCINNGLSSAQFLQLDGLLGKPLKQYIEHHFFSLFSDHIKLFKQMPSAPFIWHLSSGEQQGFEAYIIIYKWNRDSLYKLKSTYLSKRTESLQYRLQQIRESTTGQAQSEKETIRLQLQEIDVFARKIDELIAEGYDPKLDDGVGKNIAPLQKKGMLRAEVLKSTQLQKYLNADW